MGLYRSAALDKATCNIKPLRDLVTFGRGGILDSRSEEIKSPHNHVLFRLNEDLGKPSTKSLDRYVNDDASMRDAGLTGSLFISVQ